MQVLSPLDIIEFHDGQWNHRGYLSAEELEEDHIVHPVGTPVWEQLNSQKEPA